MPAPPEHRPEQTFFKDPALDRAVGMIMTLAAELYVLRDRQRARETLLACRGLLDPAALEHYAPEPAEAEAIKAERDAFVASLMEQLLGRQVSKGPLD